MSLSANDLLAIRTIVREELDERIIPLEGKVEAVENDIKEIYFMLASPSCVDDK